MKNLNSKQSGFTLIELLVVIAIIGILSAVVLASLKSARLAANESTIIQHAKQMIIIAENIYKDTGSYELMHKGAVFNCDEFNDTGKYKDELIRLCNKIRASGASIFSGAALDGGSDPGCCDYTEDYSRHSITLRLFYDSSGAYVYNRYYCVSTNGNTFLGNIGVAWFNAMSDPIWSPPHPPGCVFNP